MTRHFSHRIEIKKITTGTLLLSCIIFFSNIIYAQNNNSNQTNLQSVTWQDGATKRRLQIIPDMIAEFPAEQTSEKSNISKTDSNARIVYKKLGVQIWMMNQQTIKSSIQRGIIPANIKGKLSPVFRNASGQKRALPGNIIVYMDKGWDKEKVYAWAKNKNLEIIKCISTYSNAYLIKTSPGMNSLNMANNLIGAPGVISASPNWWKEVAPR